jgi:amino acid adenylation domain-containing protein
MIDLASLSTFVADLRARDVKLWLDGDRLRVNAPAGTLTTELQAELRQRKTEIVALLRTAHDSNGAGQSIEPAPRGTPLPLSSSQQRLWFLDQFEPGHAAYNIPSILRLRGELDRAVLQHSLDAIVGRHEALRTRFATRDGQPVQVVEAHARVELEHRDLGDVEEPRRWTEALNLVRQFVVRPFDLAVAPPLRAALVRLADDDHVLAIVVHHIAADGWSLGIIGRELADLYEAFLAGRPSALPPLPIQYADYAAWQQRRLSDRHLQPQLDYWTRTLRGAPPSLELPSDHPRPARRSWQGKRQCLLLEPALVEAIKRFSRAEGITPFMFLLAGFDVLLHRLTRREDVIVGTPVANRSQFETEAIVGCFINSLVLRTDLSGNPTVRELLERVRGVALEAFANQDLPFERLVEVLQPERNGSGLPLFQVLFSVQNVPLEEPRLGDLEIDLVQLGCSARYDLTFELYERPHGMELWAEYSTDLFVPESITRLTDQYVRLLRSMLATPDAGIVDLPLLSEAERRQLLVDWNQTGLDYPRGTGVHQLFEAQVARTPDAIAAVFEDQALTYAELNARANQLAHYLRSVGVKTETIVGVYLERSLEMLVAVLGILKAGGAYLPLDPLFPPDRLAYMLADSRAPVVLTQRSLRDTLDSGSSKVLVLDSQQAQIAQHSAINIDEPCDGDRLVYLLYTSGSTGRPKGVQVVHSAVVNLLNSMRERPGCAAGDVVLSVTTLSFDIAGLELFLPLTTGARVVLISSAVGADGARLLAALHESDATIMQATPATWRLLLAAGWEASPRLRVWCGGDVLSPELANQLLARTASVWNLYGPTETTIWSTVHQVRSIDERRVPIGRPIGNTRAYVLDSRLQPVPVGVAGELYLGGDGLARGYLNQPDLTAAKFVADPFAARDAARMYRTGDVVRYQADGTLEYLERADTQVKVRGYRIELAEIESLLEHAPSVSQAVVVVREDARGDKCLAAYIVSAGGSLNRAELRASLREKLPGYMVPTTLTVLQAMPMTPNGKVDRKALAREQPDVDARPLRAPEDAVQRTIARIWQEVLGISSVGVDDNFFDLGGHSLLILQVHARLRETFVTDLNVAEMFQFSTVETLAARVQRNHRREHHQPGHTQRRQAVLERRIQA